LDPLIFFFLNFIGFLFVDISLLFESNFGNFFAINRS